ncbi:MAG: hypothetical protein KDE31_32755 [Caldilineaceae bacterium]|nr:hypothetical protein [Caldilineaceae bacterium]
MDYEHTLQQSALLADIRFKLLAFVPTLAGVSIVFLGTNAAPQTALAVGLLGFIVTIGITFYDIRNTQFYDAIVHRARSLEALLDLPICSKEKPTGGLFNERPGRALKSLGIFAIWHDQGLAMVYGAALGGWALMIAYSSLSLAQHPNYRIALAIAVLVGTVCAWQYQRLSGG